MILSSSANDDKGAMAQVAPMAPAGTDGDGPGCADDPAGTNRPGGADDPEYTDNSAGVDDPGGADLPGDVDGPENVRKSIDF